MVPKISVLMGIYNCEATLPAAIDCILAQTVENWELILCDDGSADNTFSVAQGYVDKYPEKIILLKNEKNMGLNHTLNRCLETARGEYIARMDGDDLCSPDRFKKELAALEAHPEMALVSTAMTYFDWTMFEPPLWLLGCMTAGLLSLFVSSRRGGNLLLFPLCIALALYGLTRDGSFLTGFWQLIQPALLLALAAISLLNLTIRLPRRRMRKRVDSPSAPRMTDAPRLCRTKRSA